MNQPAGLEDAIRGCSSWQDIRNKWANFSEKRKGDLFEELVKAYLQLEPEYAGKLKHVWLQREVPQAIARKLKLPPTDQGIDIVAESHDGEFWAIQCKYRHDSDHSLTWREISTFTGLAFGVCHGIVFGLVCSTTERFTRVLKDQERVGFCALDVWQALDADFLKRLRAHLGHKPAAIKPLKPRPHQKGAVKDGHAHFVAGKAKRGKLIMPCGSGKSLTAWWIAEKLGSRRIVIVVPSLALIRQTLKVWLRETQANQQVVEWICVCSDESAGRVERDDSAVLRQDLGVPCLTDPTEIAAWLERKHRGLTVVFTTYQSGETLAKAARAAKFSFDLGIMDEAHKTVGDGGKLFSHLLHDKNLPIRRRLFMTATERRYKGQSDTVLSMDDPATYGETFHVSGKTPTGTRARVIGEFARAERALITNARCLTEGVDVPGIDCVLFADPRRSAVDIVQAVGRALHPAPNKQYGYVIVPILHDADATADDIFKSPAFKEILTTLRALAANDDRIIEYFRGVSQGQQRKGGGSVEFDIEDRLAKRIDLADFAREIELKCWDKLAKMSWRPFEEAREFARGLGLKGQREWNQFSKGALPEKGALPVDIPSNPDKAYADCGWVGMGDWLGTGTIAPRLRRYRNFVEARIFARSLKLKSGAEWQTFCQGKMPHLGKLPVDIPAVPLNAYADKGWSGMGDWIGTGNVASSMRKYRPFPEARAFVRGLKLTSVNEWRGFYKGKMPHLGKLPADIPTNPNSTYADNGWKTWGDWLGTDRISDNEKRYRSFTQARSFARSLKLKSRSEWLSFCRGEIHHLGQLPADIPATPHNTYADKGWKSMGDWLGSGRTATHLRAYRPFPMARVFAWKLKLKSGKEWKAFSKGDMTHLGRLPADIPANPNRTYADKGWVGMGDWLGTGNVANYLREYRPFLKARAFARKLKLKTQSAWFSFCKGDEPHLGKLPADIPTNPAGTYADQGWQYWGDWLGTGNRSTRQREYRNFVEARVFARGLKLRSETEWRAFYKGEMPHLGALPADIPTNPDKTYADKGWKGMGDWLGTGRTRVSKSAKRKST